MKTKTKLLIAIGFIAALCIGFLAGISVDYPKLDKSDVAGTFGKAEKYRKAQMTEKDIQLRSELVKDTAQLKSMIQGLVYFSLFTGEFSNNIDASIIAFKTQGLASDKIKALQDYSDFIKNNNEALKVTIDMLSGFYLKDTADMSWDVEKSLKDFGTYVNNLNEKNAVLSQALRGMDNFMLSNKTLQANKTEFAKLKSIRDQLLIKSVQNSGLLCNKEQADNLIKYALSSQEQLIKAWGREQLIGIYGANEKLQVYNSKQGIQSFLDSKQLGVIIMSNQNLTGAGSLLLYDKSGLQFLFGDKAQLNSLLMGTSNLQYSLVSDKAQLNLRGTSNLQSIAYSETGKLNIILSNYSLQNILQSKLLDSYLATNSLTRILSMSNLQAGFSSTQGLNSFMDMVNRNIGIQEGNI